MKKLFLIFAFFILLALPLVSALFPVYVWNEETKTARIYDWFYLDKIMDIELIENTEQCLVDCYAIIKIIPNQDVKTNINFEFENIKGKKVEIKKLKTYQLIKKEEEIFIDDWGICKKEIWDNQTNQYKEIEYSCIVGNHTEIREEKYWKKVNLNPAFFKKLDNETYIKIEGKKEPFQTIDWIPLIQIAGIDLKIDEMAWWNASWSKKKPINASISSGATEQNFQLKLNITYDSDMKNDFSDLRFVNASENTELDYWINYKETINGTYAIVYVEVDVNITTQDQIIAYMYYNNPSATTTSNGANTFIEFQDFEGQTDGNLPTGWTAIHNVVKINSTRAYIDEKSIACVGTQQRDYKTFTQPSFPFIVEFYSWFDNAEPSAIFSISDDGDYTNSIFMRWDYDPVGGYGSGKVSVYDGTVYKTLADFTDEEWDKWELLIGGLENTTFYLNDVQVGETSISSRGTPAELNALTPQAHDDQLSHEWFDVFIVRKWTDEPISYFIGDEETVQSIATSLITPPNNTITSTSSINFSCNATAVNLNLANITLYIWNSSDSEIYKNTKIASGTFDEKSWIYNLPYDDSFKWNCFAIDTTSNYFDWGNTNRTIILDTTSPTIILNAPINNDIFPTKTINLNYSVNDLNLDSCWYNLNNGSENITLPNCADNTTIEVMKNTNYILDFYANDTLGNEAVISRNFTVVNVDVSQTYNTITTEYKIEQFGITIEKNSSLIIIPIFYYNSISYSNDTSIINGSYHSFNKSIQIPSVSSDSSFSFNWSFNITFNSNSEIFYSSTNTQTVRAIGMKLCDATKNVPFLNISYKNESTSENYMNASVANSIFNFWIDGNQTNAEQYLYSTNIQSFNHTFCFVPADENFDINMTYNYVAIDYPQRQYVAELSLTNSTTQKTLWLLSNNDGIYVTFQVINVANQVLEGTYITVKRTIGGTSYLIEAKTTDAAGSATFWLNPNYLHTFTFNKTGYDIYTMSIYPTQSTYTVTLGEETPSSNVSNYYRGISYNIYPKENILQNDTTYIFRFNISSNYWALEEYGFQLVNRTGYVYATSNIGTAPTGGNVSKSFNLTNIGNETWIAMNYYWKIEGNYTNGTHAWGIYSTYEGEFSIKNFFDDFNIFMQDPIFGAHGGFTKTLIAFFIIFMVIGILAYISGIYSPLAILSGITVMTWLFSHPDVNLITPINNLWVFIPVVLTIVTIAYAIWEFRS